MSKGMRGDEVLDIFFTSNSVGEPENSDSDIEDGDLIESRRRGRTRRQFIISCSID